MLKFNYNDTADAVAKLQNLNTSHVKVQLV